jgi:protein involved in polysaccharide export with SLBB domain
VAGRTVAETKAIVEEHLKQYLREPFVSVSLLEMAGMQQIMGEHLVRPDGTVNLGTYGSVSVVGRTIPEAKLAIEAQLSQFLEAPEVAVDIFAYNSKIYYVITEGAGMGDQVTRFPVTGNETVLDALANIGGTTSLSSKRIWIARPTPYDDQVQILPIDWEAITARGCTGTNYQVFPGDRVFISEDQLVAADTRLGKLMAPVERVMGFTILSLGTVSRFSGNVLQNANFNRGIGGF